ncbi:hypothetical protein Tco_0927486 [Tanacetum coccineum]
MGSHTLQQLKRYSFDELKELFEITMKNVNTFVPMETEVRGRVSELAAGSSQATIINSVEVGSSKRDAEAELYHEGSKRQKTNEASGSSVYTEGLRKYWKITRVGNHTKAYQFFEDMLKIFDMDDLVMLWNLVKEKFSSTEPTDDKERALWVELKRVLDIVAAESNNTSVIIIQRLCLIPSTYAHSKYKVWSNGSEDQLHLWRTSLLEETLIMCFTMPVEPALSHKEPSSDARRVKDDLDL